MAGVMSVGSGLPVVFLHGNPDCKEGWQDVLDLLYDDYRCIAVDLPGFGAEATVPSYTELLPWALARTLTATLDELGVTEPAVLVAHNLGALMAASMLLYAEDRVRGVLLINTTFAAGYRGHLWGYLWSTPLAGPPLAGLMRRGLPSALAKASPKVDARHVRRMQANLDSTTCEAISRYYRVMYNPITKAAQYVGPKPAERQVPMRVLWGAGDRYIPRRFAEIPGAPLRLVEGATHWLQLERPDLVAEEVRLLAADS